MNAQDRTGPAHILLVEDNPGDVRLTQEALRDSGFRNRLHVVGDGARAIEFLRREGPFAKAPRPHLILLDLNLPGKSGLEVLAEIKTDPDLRRIPVVVLTLSQATPDILAAYSQHANCYVTKPLDMDRFVEVIRAIRDFWFGTVQLCGE